jgi:dienelactone hydrolase
VIAIDAPFARRSGAPIAFTRRDRAEQIQLIVDLRRAVDLLRARADVDDDRIAYLGMSYGAVMGVGGRTLGSGRAPLVGWSPRMVEGTGSRQRARDGVLRVVSS